MTMTRNAHRTRMLALAAGTALVTLAMGGCATKAAPRADLSAGRADVALKQGKAQEAVTHAEAAVLADPRNPAYRAMLASAYLEAGRFQSAAATFDDAMKLGDNSARTALSFALAKIAAGDNDAAVAVLNDWRDDLPPADLGLALALAGEPDQGVLVLANALRGGDATPKLRQNLAYAYALQGNWRAARLMAAEDVPADQLDARISQWAMTAKPEDYGTRVAALIGVTQAADPGQPVELALANNPSAEQLAAEATAQAASPAEAAPQQVAATGELPALDQTAQAAEEPAPALAVAEVPSVEPPHSFQDAFAAPAPTGATPAQVMTAAAAFVTNPVVQAMPARYGAAVPDNRPRRVSHRSIAEAAPASVANGTHLVQLGSFASEQGARRAWGIYTSRFPQLAQYEMVITQAQVRGKSYWRVSAGGFQSASARSMCSSVQARGQGCIAWAEGRPLPGAVDTGVRMASR
jgi:Flp pilus assembly protein TadD